MLKITKSFANLGAFEGFLISIFISIFYVYLGFNTIEEVTSSREDKFTLKKGNNNVLSNILTKVYVKFSLAGKRTSRILKITGSFARFSKAFLLLITIITLLFISFRSKIDIDLERG